MLSTLGFDHPNTVMVVAHRGASANFPENTMIAFEGAVAAGADMIELDVQLSADGIPVVFHDETLDAHTNALGFVDQYSWDELKQLDAGSWFDVEYAGQRIPSLQQVLTYAAGKIALNIEIKGHAKGGIEEKCIQLVRACNMQEQVLFSSFDYIKIARLKKLDGDIPTALLYQQERFNALPPSALLKKYRADAFHCSYRELSGHFLEDLTSHNIPVLIYTVNNKQRMQKLMDTGVNGIFTDKPDLLRVLLARQE